MIERTRVDARALRWVFAALLAAAGAWALWQPDDWSEPARQAGLVLWLALLGWTLLALDDLVVALLAVLATVLLGLAPPEALYRSLGHELIWLLLGAGVLAVVLADSGLVERWTWRALSGVRSVQALLYRLTAVIAATAFVLPSTTVRATLLLPVFLVLVRRIGEPRLALALALLFPSVILLSTSASLLGAGAHLVAIDQLRHLGLEPPHFLAWIALAAPFAWGSCLLAAWLIGRFFLAPGQGRCAPPDLPPLPAGPLDARRRAVATVAALTVAGWMSVPWHGIDAAMVGLAGAVLAASPPLTGSAGLRRILPHLEWGLLLFLACSLLLGEVLLSSGAAAAFAQAALQALPGAARQPAGAVALAAAITLLSHLVLHSRSARVVVLLPTLALPLAAGGGIDPTVLVMVVVLGSGYCQTTVHSAKPLLQFARSGEVACSAADLLRLALGLLPPLALALVALPLWLWPLQGWPLWRP